MFCSACGQLLESSALYCVRCDRAVSARAMNQGSPLERGLAFMRDGDYETATEYFLEALAGCDDKAPALLLLAYVYWLRDDLSAAEDWLRQVIVLEPEMAHAHAMLGSVLMDRDRVEAARAELDLALQLAPDDVRVRIKRAEFFYRLGCFAESCVELEHALRVCTSSAELRSYARDLLCLAQQVAAQPIEPLEPGEEVLRSSA